MQTKEVFIDIEALDPKQAKKLSLLDFQIIDSRTMSTLYRLYPGTFERLCAESKESGKKLNPHAVEIIKKAKKESTSEFDAVERPAHYAKTSIECIDAMIETQGVEAVKHFCECNAFKYLWRHNSKNGDEDVRKASWYLNKAVEIMEGGST